jgi:hypothetical protein
MGNGGPTAEQGSRCRPAALPSSRARSWWLGAWRLRRPRVFSATRRAEVIEGKLRLLYVPEHHCTAKKQIAEWILHLGEPGGAPELLVVERRLRHPRRLMRPAALSRLGCSSGR